MAEFRCQIILDYSKWTALSALRSGAPIKSRADVYPLLDGVAFGTVLTDSQPIAGNEFDAWHEAEVSALCTRDSRVRIGWGAKLINVYLKTAAYVGELGRPGLRDALHPPVDSGLWDGLRKRLPDRPDIIDETCCVQRIKDITDYVTYRR